MLAALQPLNANTGHDHAEDQRESQPDKEGGKSPRLAPCFWPRNEDQHQQDGAPCTEKANQQPALKVAA